MSYITNILNEVSDNTNYRKVLFTGKNSQLVVMDIPVGGEIGTESHAEVEQSIFIMSGEAKVILDGDEGQLKAGDVVVITPKVSHNIVNTGVTSLKIYTVYAPANHLDGRIHRDRAAAEADLADEQFGQAV